MTRITDVWAVIPRGTNEPQDWRTAMAQILVVVESDTGQRGYGVGGGGKAGIHVIDTVLREVVTGQDPPCSRWDGCEVIRKPFDLHDVVRQVEAAVCPAHRDGRVVQ